ncbi:MAG: cysteine desulfurase [Clostridiales Family XIII bacterium]|jgi:cysteine desulfurase|nr:cysteine desulfurase [Clostridiales Family XIII bacterium]
MQVYLDHAATTKPYDEVIEIMGEVALSQYANPSSLHSLGLEAEKLLKKSRKTIADAIHAKPEQIIFTSGGTESDSTAIYSAFPRSKDARGRRFMHSDIEHPAVRVCGTQLLEEGADVLRIPVDSDGLVDLGFISTHVGNTDKLDLISVMHVNNEVSTVEPIGEIGKILSAYTNDRNTQPIFHVDAVQSFMKHKIDVTLPEWSRVDMISMSGHKIGGPRGIGALYVRDLSKIKPFMIGGGQERGYRSGTENLPAIVGFSKAVEIRARNLQSNYEHVTEIKKYFYEKLLQNLGYIVEPQNHTVSIPQSISLSTSQSASEAIEVRLNGPSLGEPYASPYLIDLSFIGVPGEILLHELESRNVYISTGSACSSNTKSKNNQVLKAIGVDLKGQDSAVRFSFAPDTTIGEIDYAVAQITEAVETLSVVLKFAGVNKR